MITGHPLESVNADYEELWRKEKEHEEEAEELLVFYYEQLNDFINQDYNCFNDGAIRRLENMLEEDAYNERRGFKDVLDDFIETECYKIYKNFLED